MKKVLQLAVLGADLMVIGLSVILAYRLRYSDKISGYEPGAPRFAEYHWAVLFAVSLWVLIFLTLHLDDFPPAWESADILRRVMAGVAALMLALLAISYLQRLYYSRLLLSFLAVLLVIGLLVVRLVTRSSLRYMRRHGIATRRLVILGHLSEALEVESRIQQDPILNYDVVGILIPNGPSEDTPGGNGVIGSAWIGSSGEVSDLLETNQVSDILLTLPIGRNSELLDLLARCQQHGVTVRLVADFYKLYPYSNLVNLATLPVLEVRQFPHQYFLKRPFDMILGSILILLLAPILLAIAVLLRWSHRGQIIVRHTRIGQHLRPFAMYRFNNFGSEALSTDWQARSVNFLDKYSLLDLPQLFNVLRGHMSLVGPRPETPERVRVYSEWNKKRLAVKPGITGYAQVRGLRGSSLSDEKTQYDLRYLVDASFLGDLFLLLRTAVVIVLRFRRGSPISLGIEYQTELKNSSRVSVPRGNNADY